MPYIGRFAPSPTGPLHTGSLVAALASWLDARAHSGTWLVRMEDVDTTRAVPGAAALILRQLASLGLVSDAPVLVQSERSAAYAAGLAQLIARGLAYPCTCSRSEIAAAYALRGLERARGTDWVYPGTCKEHPPAAGAPATAWRFNYANFIQITGNVSVNRSYAATLCIANGITHWHDRAVGAQQQNVAQTVGDFVLQRADGIFSYQLAVVLDDALQGITHVVRGVDLVDNTARQIALQMALGLPQLQYLHTPLVLGADGEKLSKQNGALALDTNQPAAALRQAAQLLGLQVSCGEKAAIAELFEAFTHCWREKHGLHCAQFFI